MLMKLTTAYLWSKKTTGVDYTDVLRAAFTCADPKSAKRYWWLDCLFVLFGFGHIKASIKHVGEIDLCIRGLSFDFLHFLMELSMKSKAHGVLYVHENTCVIRHSDAVYFICIFIIRGHLAEHICFEIRRPEILLNNGHLSHVFGCCFKAWL